MRVLLDMDGVVADFVGSLLEQYNFLTGEQVKSQDVQHVKTARSVKDPATIKRIIETPGFIRGLKPMPGAIDGVNSLVKSGHEVYFVSNGTNCPTSGHEKREWLKYYFSKTWRYAPLVLTYHKFLVQGDCLADDDPKNLQNLDSSTTPLIWHHPYNADVSGYTRIYDWSHMLDWVSRQ